MDDEKTQDSYRRILPALTKHLESNPEQLRDVLKYIIIIGSSLRLQLDVDMLLKEIALACCKALRFRYSAIYLSNGAGLFRVRATSGISENEEAYLFDHPLPDSMVALMLQEEYRISDSYFIPAEAPIWQNEEFTSHFVVVNEGSLSPVSPRTSPASSPEIWMPEDLLVVPLLGSDSTLLGYFTPDAPLSGLRPTVEIMTLFELFANQAAVAIEGARLYAGLREALRQARESERIKDQFLMTASHELRTPLTAVQGYLELLSSYGESLNAATTRKFLDNARRACEELVLLLGNVMDAGRIDQQQIMLKPGPVRLQQSVQMILEILDPVITRSLRAITVSVPAEYVAVVDDLRLRQILLNLVGNALKYTPAGTPVEISAVCIDAQELLRRVERGSGPLPALSTGRFVVIAVRDWGPGIAPEEQARLFNKFVRLDDAVQGEQQGTGLGLYLCRQLTEAMGGAIWLESRGVRGEGTTFFVALPLYRG